ncbi:glycosyltransferase family 4 protein [Robertmurraya sp. DFI.2.37]|uniref:glycosyltransferase family 4 protein n=1 Tax=Robertmurraya sp. DFI.2.37 TaxID=3031819 RepID=UPI001247D5AF|nr:glycosyltransferase family 4 protein [Robertmurraya sp. DFI.2.37]MDF1508413.1 glycosyltransferase family 4 protein [Robertmurraya sp. DFI.2.37]
MRKILFTATIDEHIWSFHLPYLKWFKENGFEVHIASSGKTTIPFCDQKFHIPFQRSPFNWSNWQAYKQLKRLIHSQHYSLIHCHTPMGGALTRWAAKEKRKEGTAVVYTAHGFHLYRGAPWMNWAIYYPVEKWLSRYTDCLVTINNEDYVLGQRLLANQVRLVNGVGLDLKRFTPPTKTQKSQLRAQYHYSENDFILIFVAELNENKQQDLLIRMIDKLKAKIPTIKLLLVGDGLLREKYRMLVEKHGLRQHVFFLGYRSDIAELLSLSDVALSSSKREGLPVNIMEAMAVGLPVVATDCRGNRDLVKDGETGFLIAIDDVEKCSSYVEVLYHSPLLRKEMGDKGMQYMKKYSLQVIEKEMAALYFDLLQMDREQTPSTFGEVINE